jgi:hypothetical protein
MKNNLGSKTLGQTDTTAPWRAEVDNLKRKLADLEGSAFSFGQSKM